VAGRSTRSLEVTKSAGVDTSEKEWSPVALLLLFCGSAVATAAYGLINGKWGWVVLSAGVALIGLTHAMNIGTVRGSFVKWFSLSYDSWGPWSLRLNTIGNVLAIAGVIAIWAQ
jgi:hypothetical protein